ncbi:peptidase M28 [Alkaliphilus metalliredigens QYMF]|uniref:Peptidase M28 n=1 Tax=Alkaliphilus metalliredigens (strain QYMF) TaxID=293826 RepID=A6TWZ8_ALKMQ|nr:M28 family peptidase [Alkaliphilus metalliredigens]ABR50716.1 peptidase M28 [Alkaliphilus metalliredigens QYMF]
MRKQSVVLSLFLSMIIILGGGQMIIVQGDGAQLGNSMREDMNSSVMAMVVVDEEIPIEEDVKPWVEQWHDQRMESYGVLLEGVLTLTSDEHRGRLPGTEGNHLTVEYIEKYFKEIGLQPHDQVSYLQGFQQMIYHPDEQALALRIHFKDGTTREAELGMDYTEQSRVMREVEMTAPITFNIKDEDIKEKVIILDGPEEIQHVYDQAQAVLIKRKVLGNSLRVWDKIMDNGEARPAPFMFQISQELFETLQAENVESVSLYSKLVGEEKTIYNVAGRIPGKDSNKVVVISAHIDHLGWAGEKIFRGVVDNAAGVAVMMDLVQRLHHQSIEEPFQMDIIFVGFNSKKSEMLGSNAYIKQIKDKYDKIYNINIDCVGRKTGGPIIISGGEEINQALKKNITKYLAIYGINVEGQRGFDSDHLSFNKEEIRGVTLGQRDVLTVTHNPEDIVALLDFDYIKGVSLSIYDFIVAEGYKSFD